jgi:hypothetical protein
VTHDDDGVQEKGYEGAFLFEKNGGTFGGEFYVDTRSPGFDVNDLGFMDRNNRTQVGGWVRAHIRNPWWFARESEFNFNVWRHWNHDGVPSKRASTSICGTTCTTTGGSGWGCTARFSRGTI